MARIKIRKGFDVKFMLARLSQDRKVNGDGSVSYIGWGTSDEYASYFLTAVEAPALTDAFLKRAIKKAMHVEQDMDEGRFINNVNKAAENYLRSDLETFKVIFPYSCSPRYSFGRTKWGNVSLNFSVSRETNFYRCAVLARGAQVGDQGRGNVIEQYDFSSFPIAVASTRAIDLYDAFEQAERAMSIELGIYSIFDLRGQYLVASGSRQVPLANNLVVPHITVHRRNGDLAGDIFWYGDWAEFTRKSVSEKIARKNEGNVKYVKKKMKCLPSKWKQKAVEVVARHYRAFSKFNLEEAFLEGWRLLELLAGHDRERAEVLVRRAAFFFEEHEKYRQIGTHLMHRRNLISHGRPIKGDDNENLAHQVREFINPLLIAFLTNPFGFESIEEFWQFCDLPTSRSQRKRASYLLECSAKFRREI